MNKLQRIEEMEKQLAALRAEVEREAKSKRREPKGGSYKYQSSTALAEEPDDALHTYNRLLAYKDEFDADFVPDWDNGCWDKFYLYTKDGIWFSSSDNRRWWRTVYFSKQAAEDLCNKLNSGEVVL
jgi:hypothetical protein